MYPMYPNYNSPYDPTDPMGLREKYRRVSLQGTSEAPTAASGPAQVPENPLLEAYRRLSERGNGPSYTAYMDYLRGGAPSPGDYKPGKLSRLGAILSGGAAGWVNPGQGAEVATSILNRPYEMAIRRYGLEGQRLGEAARLEESSGQRELNAIKTAYDMDRTGKRDALDYRKTEGEIELQGERYTDPGTGIEYRRRPDGTKVIIGQAKEPILEEEARIRDRELQRDQRRFNYGRQQFDYEFGKTQPELNRRQQAGFANEREMEKYRQQGRIDLATTRSTLPNSETYTNLVKKNKDRVRAEVLSKGKEYYGNVATVDENGEITLKTVGKDHPDYLKFVKLYNLLNSGLTDNEGNSFQLGEPKEEKIQFGPRIKGKG